MDDQKIIDIIKKYKELLDMGAITQEEFDVKKAELLCYPQTALPPVAAVPLAVEPEQDNEPQYVERSEEQKAYASTKYAQPFAWSVLAAGFLLVFLLGGFALWIWLSALIIAAALVTGYLRKGQVEKTAHRLIPFSKVVDDTKREIRLIFSKTFRCIVIGIAALLVLCFTISSCSGAMDDSAASSQPVAARPKTTAAQRITTTTTTTVEPTTTTTKPPQEYKDSCKSVSFEQLSRNDDLALSNVKVKGEVVQALPDGDAVHLRVNITNEGYFWDDTVYVVYTYHDGEDRILEDDIVNVYGVFWGQTSYESTLGATITLPLIYAEYIDRAK